MKTVARELFSQSAAPAATLSFKVLSVSVDTSYLVFARGSVEHNAMVEEALAVTVLYTDAINGQVSGVLAFNAFTDGNAGYGDAFILAKAGTDITVKLDTTGFTIARAVDVEVVVLEIGCDC